VLTVKPTKGVIKYFYGSSICKWSLATQGTTPHLQRCAAACAIIFFFVWQCREVREHPPTCRDVQQHVPPSSSFTVIGLVFTAGAACSILNVRPDNSLNTVPDQIIALVPDQPAN
jgi:hypothetical protein